MQTEAHCSNVLVPTQLISFYEQAATSKSRASVCIVEIWFDAYQDVHHPSSMTFGSLFEIRASVMWLTPKSSSADAAIGAAGQGFHQSLSTVPCPLPLTKVRTRRLRDLLPSAAALSTALDRRRARASRRAYKIRVKISCGPRSSFLDRVTQAANTHVVLRGS
jgi:hypothetical protein